MVLEQALETSRNLKDRILQAEVLNRLGTGLRVTGRPDRATECHREAVELASATADRYELGRAYQGLGNVCQDLDDHNNARLHWEQALAHFTALGIPEATRLRATLAHLDADGNHGIPKA